MVVVASLLLELDMVQVISDLCESHIFPLF